MLQSKVFINELLTRHKVKVKFVIVGFWNTVIGYGIFCLLDTSFTGLFANRSAAYMSAMILSQILSVIIAYLCHKYITFQSHAKGKAIIIEFIKFSTTYAGTFCLSLVLLPFLVKIGHIDPKISAAIIIPICAVCSYLGHSRFSFNSGHEKN